MSQFDYEKNAAESDRQVNGGAYDNTAVVGDGNLKYTVEEGGNTSLPTYQEASGAPVEVKSPLGYSVGWVTILFLNLSKIIGTGIFSTPSTILRGTGSVGLALFFWVIGFLIAASSLTVYLEFASYFPSRSGAEVAYLEQAYPRPKYFFPTVFAVQTVILSFSSSNAIVLAQYLFKLAGHTPSPWEQKGVAVAGYTVAVFFLIFNTRWSLRLSNAIGFIKLLTLIFIGITGLVVLGGHTRVKDPTVNFRNAFEGSSDATAYGATNAIYKVIFAYAGYDNAFNLVNEVKNPIKTLRWSAPLSLLVATILYMLANIAYFSAATKEEILKSKAVAASVFFENVFGTSGAAKALNFLIMLSAFGNLLAVLVGQSRVIRECGRQGVLPFTKFWTSTKPFGTPLGPYFLKWALTILMIIAPPAGDAFNFVIDLSIYPSSFFQLTLAVGLLVYRWRRKHVGLPKAEYRAWDVAVYFCIAANLYSVIMPWYPPAGGATGGDVSFWYATYCVVGIGIIIFCGVYYYVWIHVLPKFGKYEIRQTVLVLDESGATTHQLVRVPNAELAAWDAEHDVVGRVVQRRPYGEDESK
ncbi:high affinity methionine permease [Mytilinidion resinicola]|uniref:High affinity methionine permease n=1 Tax=Mytilinidion resinicola TaxID=574789 RepID=A0A6A6YT72_9PEZI|nr:high affinity methionine permease [Mytilinidion resinicola]KAF2811971.1 high affinity methionine permease [Mytilinidion resinicola]